MSLQFDCTDAVNVCIKSLAKVKIKDVDSSLLSTKSVVSL